MKVVAQHNLISAGSFANSQEWQSILDGIVLAVSSAEWPLAGHPLHIPGQFVIHPQSGKKSGEGNGVVPIKVRPMAVLKAAEWSIEHPWEVGQREQGADPATERALAELEHPDLPAEKVKVSKKGSRPGDIDAAKLFPQGLVVVEWETGNVSSSHRSLNKMALGLVQRKCVAGVLVVPNSKLARFLTDRIGNIEELLSYFPMWKALRVAEGALVVLVIEQDGDDVNVPKIPKGADGRAKEGAAKKKRRKKRRVLKTKK